MGKILIVDDEPDLVKIYEARLKAHNYATLSAANGAKALEIVKQTEIDLIFMDYYLPDMTGLEACKRIREELKNEIPIIFISANEDVIKELPDFPKTEKIVKPVSADKMLEFVKKYIPNG